MEPWLGDQMYLGHYDTEEIGAVALDWAIQRAREQGLHLERPCNFEDEPWPTTELKGVKYKIARVRSAKAKGDDKAEQNVAKKEDKLICTPVFFNLCYTL